MWRWVTSLRQLSTPIGRSCESVAVRRARRAHERAVHPGLHGDARRRGLVLQDRGVFAGSAMRDSAAARAPGSGPRGRGRPRRTGSRTPCAARCHAVFGAPPGCCVTASTSTSAPAAGTASRARRGCRGTRRPDGEVPLGRSLRRCGACASAGVGGASDMATARTRAWQSRRERRRGVSLLANLEATGVRPSTKDNDISATGRVECLIGYVRNSIGDA